MKVSLTDSQLFYATQASQNRIYGRPSAKAGVTSLSGSNLADSSISSVELEKHIRDYKKGYGKMSAQTGNKLRSINTIATTELTYDDPKLSNQFAFYKTALPYDKNSRYVNSVSSAAKRYTNFMNAYDEYKKLTSEDK